jgi:hypothetical protein
MIKVMQELFELFLAGFCLTMTVMLIWVIFKTIKYFLRSKNNNYKNNNKYGNE